MSDPAPSPSPITFFNAMSAYQVTAALKSAIEIGLFTAIGEGVQTAPELGSRCGVAERGARILADYMVVNGFLGKSGDRYSLTPDSAVFLDQRSPAYMGGVIEFMLSPTLKECFENLTGAVRQGGTAVGGEGTMAPEHPVWVQFARAMMPMMARPAAMIASMVPVPDGPIKVLDIAAGHGLFGIAFAKQHGQAQVIAQDWGSVLAVAQENAAAAGVTDRYRLLPGSAFDVEFGEGYDVVLLTNFLHHFDAETCTALLRKVHGALKPGGSAVTLEFVPNEDRVTPPGTAGFALVMLASTSAGDAYTFAELEAMAREAGFSSSEHIPLPESPQSLVVSVK